MYVCLCNGVSDKKIRQVVRQFQPQSFQQLRKFVPVGNQCGKCVRAAREVMEDELTTHAGIQRNRLKSTLLF
ncbi:bacterioferritin-associated ferredoxin [Klebsiella pneumoniae]|nr:bacterioferritin-associated ferredoxin [Klebsiella pneumoniae]